MDSTQNSKVDITTKTKSIIAAFRQQQAQEYEAAQRGLYGLAIVASHQLITARMERGATRILRLLEEGKHDEALALINTETWGEDAENPSAKTTGTKR